MPLASASLRVTNSMTKKCKLVSLKFGEASQLTVIDPDLLENGLMDAAVCKKSGFGLKLLENHRYRVRLVFIESLQ